MATPVAPHPNQAAFTEGLIIVLQNWPVLKSAVDEEWGGPESREKQQWFIDTLVQYVGKEGSKLGAEDLESVMLQILQDEFNVTVDDDSVYALGKFILRMYHQCIKGDHSVVENLRREAETRRGTILNIAKREDEAGASEDDDSDDLTGSETDGSDDSEDMDEA
ncbi:rRNA accumulation- protein [Tieghemiomyces parasiticus]|uniref:rRNA accumulation- protein n=1 Tax=Tieghemiomyces parasiticus TaxID=78921 RepID=A0A9W8A6E3_9FUNG|nr:rRNA accumulation- protein [Tieghemiomyces parasiticus]